MEIGTSGKIKESSTGVNCRKTDDELNSRAVQGKTSSPPSGNSERYGHRSGLLALAHPTRRAFPSRLRRVSGIHAAFVPITVAGRRKILTSFPWADAKCLLVVWICRGPILTAFQNPSFSIVFGQKKILRAFSPKDCTLVHLVLRRSIRHHRVPVNLTSSGRSSDSRITLLSAPSRFACAKQWLYRISSP
jgi:hypothetical protein